MRKKKHPQPAQALFRGVKYQIIWRHPRGYDKNIGGTCSSPSDENPTIEISPRMNEEATLRVMIDESIHACVFDLDNDVVAQISTSMAHFLWDCGLRFSDKL